ncbi:hypothetical protein [Streptomyces sp. NPDC047928]|uniref:hypothetical protein n=1 Tax=unclassified Streptomyces TaxID=2593676 RepID=UPI003713B942
MSTPAPQPNPYQQPAYPQQQPGVPAPMPNPYAQQPFPPQAGGPGTGGQPGGPGPGGPGGPGGGFGGGPGGGPGRRSVPGWLLGVAGAVVASAVWATTLFATGTFGGTEGGTAAAKPDFGGHAYEQNLCAVAPLNAFRGHYRLKDSDARYTSQQEGLDESYCSRSLEDPKATENDYTSVHVRTSATWHKATDPSGEFASSYWAYRDKTTDKERYRYKTLPVDDLGDEAFLVTEYRGEGDDTVGSMMLAVRSGWFTYEMQWDWFGGGPDSKVKPPEAKDVREWLVKDTKEALADLQKD